jgi:hypothetical protein
VELLPAVKFMMIATMRATSSMDARHRGVGILIVTAGAMTTAWIIMDLSLVLNGQWGLRGIRLLPGVKIFII